MAELQIPLREAFSRAFDEFWSLCYDQALVAHRSEKIEVADLLGEWMGIAARVEALGLMSSNEELDDIPTANLKYLVVPFVVAELNNLICAPHDQKVDLVRRAILSWNMFMARLDQVGICKDRVKAWMADGDEKAATSLAEQRTERIRQYKLQKEITEQLQAFVQRRRERGGGTGFTWSSGGDDDPSDEEEERMLLEMLLNKFAGDALDHLRIAKQEVQLLRSRPDEPEGDRGKGDAEIEEVARKPWMMRIDHSNLEDLSKIRDVYRQSVFQPPHVLPTISLDEVARWEMEYERQHGSMSQGQKKAKTSDDESEEEPADESEKELKDREWDDWKDHNPRGWGNRNRNVG